MTGLLGLAATLLGVLGLSSAGAAQAQQPDWQDYGPNIWDDGGWMVFGPLMVMVLITVIVVVVALRVRRRGRANDRSLARPFRRRRSCAMPHRKS